MSTQDTLSGRHPVNIGHFVMGLAFLGILVIWALVQTDTVDDDDLRWLLPIPWVVAGLAGLAVTAFTGSRRYAVRQTGWVGTSPAPEPTVEEPTLEEPLAGEPLTDEPLADEPESDHAVVLEETAPITPQPDPTPDPTPGSTPEPDPQTQTDPEEKP